MRTKASASVFALAIISALSLSACQTAQQRRMSLLKDRVEKLRPLSTWKPVKCRVEAVLTEPSRARYQKMFPDEAKRLSKESLKYTWRASESSSQIIPAESTPLMLSYRSFLDATVGLLLQVYWVNSPFDELRVTPDDILDSGEQVFIRSGPVGSELGLYVDSKVFKVETRTHSRGLLTANYELIDGKDWLPQMLAQDLRGTRIVLDRFEWDSVPVGGRRMIKSVWISAGESGNLVAHSQLYFYDCATD